MMKTQPAAKVVKTENKSPSENYYDKNEQHDK